MRILLDLLVVYCVYLVLVFAFQRMLMFPGRSLKPANPRFVDIPRLDRHWLVTSSGKVEIWYIPAPSAGKENRRPAVVFCHANAELIDHWVDDVAQFGVFDVGVLLVEFPGYGRSEGRPSQKSLAEAFVMAYDWLAAREDVDRERIVAYGRSLGGGPACILAKKREIRALILQSTFTSTRQFAWRYGAPPFLIRDPFDNLSVVRNFNRPILIFHGKHDSLVPYRNALVLHKYAPDSILIDFECGHNDCPPDWNEYWKIIGKFFEDNGITSLQNSVS